MSPNGPETGENPRCTASVVVVAVVVHVFFVIVNHIKPQVNITPSVLLLLYRRPL